MRGFGSPQVAFSAECQMDELARRLGMDPFALRELNALQAGDIPATGDVAAESVGVGAALAAVRKALTESERPAGRPGWRVGVGVAASYKNVGLGGDSADEAEAVVELEADGMLAVRAGCADLGQGAATAMAQIAAEACGVPPDRMRVHLGDTHLDPPGAMTTASRETFITGNAVLAAARQWRELALSAAARVSGHRPADLTLRDGRFETTAGLPVMELDELAEALAEQGERLQARAHYVAPETHAYRPVPAGAYDPADYRMHFAYCFGVQAAVVAVDERTGEVQVLRVIAAHDAGRTINPQAVAGQIEGGIMMGLGYALSEEFALAEGRVVTDTLRKLGVPTIARLPEITTILVENPHSQGPFGAKGMAELPAAATAPAVVNAIYDAVGVRIRDLPARPERVLAGLGERGGTADRRR
jgi:aldehyde oxidoreductase